jgi:trehalose/maltose hydrolase-like predicted phosphorylase
VIQLGFVKEAQALLMYRHRLIDGARRKAKTYIDAGDVKDDKENNDVRREWKGWGRSYAGAMYPWESAFSGLEV